jgi:hypothetical protein
MLRPGIDDDLLARGAGTLNDRAGQRQRQKPFA